DGSWVSAPHSGPEGSGVHACRVEHLAWWVGEELWRVELDGPILEREMQIEAPRARLLDQVTAWDPAAFVQACVGRTEGVAAETPTTEPADYVAVIKTVAAPTAAFVASVPAVTARGTKPACGDGRAEHG